MNKFIKKYVGDKNFYRMLIALIIPLIIQQGITNFVSLLDNVMVGSLGTEPMSAVAIINQLIFVFNLLLFGGLSGASIFGAQFYGKGDNEGVKQAFRVKIIFGVVATGIAIGIFILWGESLTLLFLDNEANKDIDITVTLGYATDYLRVMLVGLIPFMVVQAYSSTLREAGETVAPMIASVISIVVNLVLNYVLIFGHFGFPEMGVVGAAIATVIARFIECIIVVIYSHAKAEKFPFMKGIYSSLYISGELIRNVIVTGMPLMLNELFWSLGSTFINQNYSTRGLDVVAAMNINTTAWQLFCVIMFAMGNAVSILVGQRLGAGDIEGAKDVDRKLIFFNFVMHLLVGLLIVVMSPFVPMLYNVEPAVRDLASGFLVIAGLSLPIHSYVHVAYFTIRSGGKTGITFLFDCVYMWVITATLSFILCRFTSLPIIVCYAIVQFSDIIKLCIAMPMLKSGFWAKNIVSK